MRLSGCIVHSTSRAEGVFSCWETNCPVFPVVEAKGTSALAWGLLLLFIRRVHNFCFGMENSYFSYSVLKSTSLGGQQRLLWQWQAQGSLWWLVYKNRQLFFQYQYLPKLSHFIFLVKEKGLNNFQNNFYFLFTKLVR